MIKARLPNDVRCLSGSTCIGEQAVGYSDHWDITWVEQSVPYVDKVLRSTRLVISCSRHGMRHDGEVHHGTRWRGPSWEIGVSVMYG
ncbi:hypothetical protein V6N12_068636 [Hibiscus sabdariffa]|uniref:Uncharacterized protein n=1 Tax=Hibiscus sabdariffa TaxID=183260 RepID=A0ABR2FR99_9ROSI